MAERDLLYPASRLHGSGRRRMRQFDWRSALFLWAPAMLAGVGMLLPVAYLLARAVLADGSIWSWIMRASTLTTLARTLSLAAGVTLACIAIALPLGWLTTRTDLPGRGFWAAALALPLILPSYVGAYLFVSVFGPRGMLQSWLEAPFGVQRLPDLYGYPGALLVLTLLSYPYVFLGVRAALQRQPASQEEAARSLGLNAMQTFWRVTLPHLRPSLAAGSLLVALYVLRDFGAVSILRYDTFTRVIYTIYRSSFDRASAATLALVLVLVTLGILLLEMRLRRREQAGSYAVHGSRESKTVALGRWRWPALLFCTLVLALALIAPGGVLLYWLGRGLLAGESLVPLWRSAGNSLIAAGLAAGAVVLFALPIAALDTRRPGWMSRLLERLSYLAYALPGIVIALALVFFGVRFAPSFYQTFAMLLWAYVILFLPQAVGALRASLLRVPVELEEAARGLGHKPWAVFRKITLPLIRPGVLAGAGLVFLTTMKELPATLLLAPTGFSTLATGVWSAVSEAYFARAAAPALLLVLLSSLPMAWMTLREHKGKYGNDERS